MHFRTTPNRTNGHPSTFDGYESSSDSEDFEPTTSQHNRSSTTARAHSDYLFSAAVPARRASATSSTPSTHIHSRPLSPFPNFYPSGLSSSCASDTDDEPSSPLLPWNGSRNSWWSEQRGYWWGVSRRRRRRQGWRITRLAKKCLRLILCHPLCPSQPITIVLSLIFFSLFAILLTLLLMYQLNPDKEPLPWRAYCAFPSTYNTHTPPPVSPPYHRPEDQPSQIPSFPPPGLDSLPPAGIFLGVFSIDSAFERRQLVRSTWASHPRSRNGANDGDDGVGTSRTLVRFVVGQPRKDWERRIRLEMETYNDIVILPMQENMNGGKTHAFFSWTSINAWVPPVYVNTTVPPLHFTYSNLTSSPPALAPHDPDLARQDSASGRPKNWVRPDYIVKVDDDAFVMLAELEARLRVELHTKQENPRHISPYARAAETGTNNTSIGVGGATTVLHAGAMASPGVRMQLTDSDPLIYWGYLVTNKRHQFMAGELYGLSWALVDWAAKDPTVKTMTKGAEDKQTAKWMRIHPRHNEIRWASERCWIYDHPRSGTVYGHGFLFPSEVTRVKRQIQESYGDHVPEVRDLAQSGMPPTPTDLAHSSVSTFGVRYAPPHPDLSISYSVEALVEGSDMSNLREANSTTPDRAWANRESRWKRYKGERVGGTVVVHFIKKHMWYLETALALLEGAERSELEVLEDHEEAGVRRLDREIALGPDIVGHRG